MNFKKILIANRGEIAVRITRACQEMGIRTVAVYSDADRAAMHVRTADEAIPIGAALPRESYLNIPNLVAAAKQTSADAIHPGYGFLAENAEFAQAVQDAGLVFIGPSPASIRAMGDKAEARARMISSRVPVVPGYQGADDDASLQHAANEIGYPILIKAAAGGGGKAMRIVRQPQDLVELANAARREALHGFGNARLILEKYIENARHIEFQVLADSFGNTLHLFERECSIQRRHQKIIEETPSPLLDAALREKMGQAAVAAARAVNYENAGTVECIVDPETLEFYFLEMNTRLQVEHPITELTTGLDLVQWQIRIAQGERLPFQQSRIEQRGHAIECRIYAEDPAQGFLPAAGRVLHLELANHPGVRSDSGIASGDEVTTFYDPLLVKVISYAETRQEAIARMKTALRDFVLLGVTTNIPFLQAVLEHPTFRAGKATTAFIEREMREWSRETGDSPKRGLGSRESGLVAVALIALEQPNGAVRAQQNGNDPYSPWRARNAYRVGSMD